MKRKSLFILSSSLVILLFCIFFIRHELSVKSKAGLSRIHPKAGSIFCEPYLNMEFVYVPPGCYKMGCGGSMGDCDPDEKPKHKVCLDGFWIGRYEVTNKQFVKFLNDIRDELKLDKKGDVVFYKKKEIFDVYCGSKKGGCFPFSEMIENVGTIKNPYFKVVKNYENHPVVLVSWYGANFFAKWLSKKTGKKFCLPTEAQWEYACRSCWKSLEYGTSTGKLSPELANYDPGNYKEDGYRFTSPVGSFPSNPLGIYDMSGNVFEWCRDFYDENYYKKSPKDNPNGPRNGTFRVIRGGSWISGKSCLRCAYRFYRFISSSYNFVGFRLVLKNPILTKKISN